MTPEVVGVGRGWCTGVTPEVGMVGSDDNRGGGGGEGMVGRGAQFFKKLGLENFFEICIFIT